MDQNEIPTVVVLKPIDPKTEAARADTFEYANLNDAIKKHAPFEYQRINKFWDEEPGSLREIKAAKQLAMHYLLMGAQVLNDTVATIPESKTLWSDRYTQASSELYGLPDTEAAREIFEAQQKDIDTSHPFGLEARVIGELLNERYADVYDALDAYEGKEEFTPEEIADRFESALSILSHNHDQAWGKWKVKRTDTDKLSVSAAKKEVNVGLYRASVTPVQLKELLTHEILVHALRAVNGAKLSVDLELGLPDYLDTEEGFGIFLEYATSGAVKDVVQDRYVDIAYALGMIDGRRHTRAELIELALARAEKRNEKADRKKSQTQIETEVYTHVNRIYRGSRGDSYVGVFTKDIAYYKGFLTIGNYISKELESGKTVEQIMDWLLKGKFDPTNEQHVAVVESYR